MKNKMFFSEIGKEFVGEFDRRVTNARSVIIASHIGPDDDSISSILAVYFYITKHLKKEAKSVNIFYTGDQEKRWEYFENFDKIQFVDDIYGYVKDEDLVIFTDGSSWKRFSRREEFAKSKADTICIDHHPTPEDKFNLHLVAMNVTSTAEVLYRLFFEKEEKLDSRLCEILYLGISGDTGNFKFLKPEHSYVFLIAERLLREGKFTVETLQSKYTWLSENIFGCLTTLMANSKIIKIDKWPRFLLSWVDREYVNKNKLKDSEISASSGVFTGYLKGVEGVSWGFVVTPRSDNSSSISLRSIPGSVNVRVMMENTGFGGGHDRASGGKIRAKEPKEAIETILAWMEKNLPVLS